MLHPDLTTAGKLYTRNLFIIKIIKLLQKRINGTVIKLKTDGTSNYLNFRVL